MDERKIDFIVCVSESICCEECMRYISDLIIPDGYRIDVLTVFEAEGMTKGYNEAMQESDAKYKVYLREDTFLLNRNFIADILDIFQKNDRIGMLGVAGTDVLLDNGDFLKWNIGSIMAYDGRCIKDHFELRQTSATYEKVEALEGTLIATQYDVSWREELTGWSFYSVSQSVEMKKQGYEVVVPYQENAWCYRDNAIINAEDYEKDHSQMQKLYPEYFPTRRMGGEVEKYRENGRMAEQMRELLTRYVEIHLYHDLGKLLERQRYNWLPDMQVQEVMNLIEIYSLEKMSTEKVHCKWFEMNQWKEMYQSYRNMRWTLLRMAYGRADSRISELEKAVAAGEISKDAIRKVENVCMCGPKGTQRDLFGKIKEEPLVSVVIPVYNGENIINETLDSVLSQTYYNMEVIVIDDASVDGSRERILAYNDDRIRSVFLEKNRHVCYAGNEGFKLACGKYVAVIGHDDVWETDKVEKQITFLEEHPTYNLCFSWADIIDENGQNRNRENKELYQRFCSGNYPTKKWIRKLLESNNFFCAPSVCIRREALQESGGYRYALVQLQDYDLWLRLLKTGEVYIFQEKLTRYRRFFEKGKNISEDNAATRIRDAHERQWIHYNNIKNMSAQEFLEIFSDDLKNPAATQEKEVLCEKAIWLWNGGNCFAEDMFAQLFEDEESRNILEEEYGVGLKDFYEMNTKPMLFDDSAMDVIKNKNRKLSEYEKRIERLEEELCKL